MRFIKLHKKWLATISALALALPVIAGCHGKEEAPSAPGFYDGPMKPKNAGTGGGTGQTQGPDTKAGSP